MPKKCLTTILYAANGGTDSFFANTDELDQYATYLKENKAKLVELLANLKTEMSSITNGWADSNGALFESKFNNFISEAEKINSELDVLASFATGQSEVYTSILSESLRIMSGG
jgi:uncharacterized protein YukE